MALKLNIFKKGLILVSVPLVCEIAFVGVLTHFLVEVERELHHEQRSKQLIADIDTVTKGWVDASFAAGTYSVSRHPLLWQRYKNCVSSINDKLAEAEELAKDNPHEAEKMREIREASKKAEQLTQKLEDPDVRNPFYVLFPGRFGPSHPFLMMRKPAAEIIDHELEVEGESQKNAAKMRGRIEQLLMGALVFNVLLTLVLTFYFAKSVSNRLRSVMDNTYRMVRRQQLNPEVGGGDEIAELDRVLHKTASELRDLEAFKQELTAMVTHELRTPLTSIQGVLTLLKVGALGDLPEMAANKVQMAESNAARLIRLINDLLDIDKMEAGKLEMLLEPVKLSGVIDQAVEAVRDFAAQSQVTIATDGNFDQWITADSERLVQVVINLVSNAVKYSPKGETVSIEGKPASAGYVQVSVVDHGRGIPAEFKDKIFERFQQVERADSKEKKGTGLGLAICKAIIDQHHGSICVESEQGKGSTFSFSIPVAGVPPAEQQSSPSEAANTVST